MSFKSCHAFRKLISLIETKSLKKKNTLKSNVHFDIWVFFLANSSEENICFGNRNNKQFSNAHLIKVVSCEQSKKTNS